MLCRLVRRLDLLDITSHTSLHFLPFPITGSEAAEVGLHKHTTLPLMVCGQLMLRFNTSQNYRRASLPLFVIISFLALFKVSGRISSHWWCHSLLANPDSQAYTICQCVGLLHCCLWNCLLCLHLLLCGGRDFGATYPQTSVLHQHLEHPGCGRHSGENPCTLFLGEQ